MFFKRIYKHSFDIIIIFLRLKNRNLFDEHQEWVSEYSTRRNNDSRESSSAQRTDTTFKGRGRLDESDEVSCCRCHSVTLEKKWHAH